MTPSKAKSLLRFPAANGGMDCRRDPGMSPRREVLLSPHDVAQHIKCTIGRLSDDMYAPAHQVITALGWSASYNDRYLQDPKDPRMIATLPLTPVGVLTSK